MTYKLLNPNQQPIMNYFVIILFVVLFAVGITPFSVDDQESINKAARFMGILLSIICVLLGLIVLYTPRETESLNSAPNDYKLIEIREIEH
jgi:amino acid permease